jgi:hypothetical protein
VAHLVDKVGPVAVISDDQEVLSVVHPLEVSFRPGGGRTGEEHERHLDLPQHAEFSHLAPVVLCDESEVSLLDGDEGQCLVLCGLLAEEGKEIVLHGLVC